LATTFLSAVTTTVTEPEPFGLTFNDTDWSTRHDDNSNTAQAAMAVLESVVRSEVTKTV
jgi:hypothetical protein